MVPQKRVLVVDDSVALVDALALAFQAAGYEVASATDGEQVFRKLAAVEPAALLLDIYMPKINGADVCRLVKAHPHFKKIWLVIMSARISDSEIEMYRRIGANEILKKPFEPAVAIAAVVRGIGAGAPSPF